ncbi:MAG: response regulator transcription factor [Clostridia bacterium]|nr:response regulator transcription factor [Clostridia bacterium]
MIFCVEDDSAIRELMTYTLSASGFDAVGLADGEAFWEALGKQTPRLILLDIMLPGENGISILKKLRASPATASVPVILATAKSTEYDKVIGLDTGADDYLTKPFGMMEMVSRVKAVLRRAAPRTSVETLRIGELEMNTGEHTVLACGERVQLTLKEYELLLTFLQNPRRAFTRDQLLSLVWGADFVGETRTVDVHIGTLRTKLGACGAYIETVRGVGYRLEEKV